MILVSLIWYWYQILAMWLLVTDFTKCSAWKDTDNIFVVFVGKWGQDVIDLWNILLVLENKRRNFQYTGKWKALRLYIAKKLLNSNGNRILYFSEYDVCDLIGKISDADCANYLKPNHIPCRCPIPEGTYTLSPHTFQIPEATGAWSWIASVSIFSCCDF